MKKENYILIATVIACLFACSSKALDSTLTIRHIIFCVSTLSLCSCLFLKKRKNLSVLNLVIMLVFTGYCIIATLSIAKATNIADSFYSVLTAWTSLLLLICVASFADKDLISKYIVYAGMVFAICVGIQILKAGHTVLSMKGLGFTCGRNLLSSTLILLLPFALYRKDKMAVLTRVLIILDIICLQTRSVYLGLFAASFFLIPGKKIKISLVIVAISLVVFTARFKSSLSLEYRMQSWRHTVSMLLQNPVIGGGAGNWKIFAPQKGNVVSIDGVQCFHQRAHNDFLETFSEIGFLGGTLYALIFAFAIYYSTKTRDKRLGLAMRFGFICYIAFAMFSFPKERATHTLLFITMLGIVLSNIKMRKEWHTRNINLLWISGIVIIPLLFINVKRNSAEIYSKEIFTFRRDKEYQKVIDVIDENYSPFAPMVNYAVTPIKMYRAEANFYLGRDNEAFNDYSEAYKLHPNHPAILTNLGYYMIKHRKYDEARKLYTRADSIFPDQPFITNTLKKLKQRQ